jgi:hypothetical protein
MRTLTILLERLMLMTCEMRHNMRFQNLIDVTGSCYSIASPRAKILEDNWTKFHVESPALSPDLNSIEHLWDYVQRRLNEEQRSPTTAAELSVAFQRVWARIPIAFINRLVNSMYRRCAAVINAGGGHTRY